MNLDLRTVYLMDAALYLMLHGAIWVGLARYRSGVVTLWSISGIVSALGIVFLGLRGIAPDWAVAIVGQVLMAAGNLGRQLALRRLMPASVKRWLIGHGCFNLAYLVATGAMFLDDSMWSYMVILFYGFYAVNLVEYILIGRAMRHSGLDAGAQAIETAGFAFTVSLGIKTVALVSGWGEFDLYIMAWDHVVVFVGQFVAISLINVGFLQVFVAEMHKARESAEQALQMEQQKAQLLRAHAHDLGELLNERAEIIRQLTLSNKSAGMGALMSNTAHEVNQPLSAIVLKSEMVESYLALPAHHHKIADLCRGIRDDVQKAAGVIRTLRNMFSLSRGRFENLNFSQLVLDVLAMVKTRSEQLGIRVEAQIDADVMLTGDAIQLQQVVLNLLNNAIDALTSVPVAQPALTVSCRVENGRVQLCVRDNGPGIDAEKRRDIFSLLKSHESGGSGVGLWLSQAIVKSHGGVLELVSAPDQGAEFCLRLPAHDPHLMF